MSYKRKSCDQAGHTTSLLKENTCPGKFISVLIEDFGLCGLYLHSVETTTRTKLLG